MQNHETDELLKQEVTDEELRELLERLGEREFCLAPAATIGDIAEAASVDPSEIGRLLAEIRKENWEDRFGIRLTDHEKRIETIEGHIKPPVVQPPPTAVWFSPISEKERQQLQYLVEKDRNKDNLPRLIIIVFALVVALALGFTLLMLGFPFTQ